MLKSYKYEKRFNILKEGIVMAKEDLRRFRDLLLTDEEFQKKFAA